MKNCLANRRFLCIFLLISIAGFLVWPQFVLADVELSKYETHLLLDSVQTGLIYGWVDLTSSGNFSEPEKQAALFLIQNAIQQKEFRYILKELPKDSLKNLVKLVIFLIGAPDAGTILDKIEKESIKKAIEIAKEWLFQNETKVASGTLNYSFTSYKGNPQNPVFYYNLAYHPLTENSRVLSIEFYSLEEIEPKAPTPNVIGLGAFCWNFDEWQAKSKEKINPFILHVKGKVSEWEGIGYKWEETVDVEVTFPEKMPKLPREEPLSLWDKIKNFFAEEFGFIQDFVTLFGGGRVAPTSKLSEVGSPKVEEVPQDLTIQETIEGEILEIEEIEEVGEVEPQSIEPEPQLQPQLEPEPKPELTLMEIQERLDDISERVDVISQEVSELTGGELAEVESLPVEPVELVQAEEISAETETVEIKGDSPETQPEPEPEPELEIKQPLQPPLVSAPDPNLPKILISEVCVGWDQAENEFVELYNPNDSEVTLNSYNFKLKLVNSSNKVTEKRIEELPKAIPAKGYFLLVGGNIENITADASFATQLTYASGVIITDGLDDIKDRVGWGKPDKPPPSEAVEGTGIVLENGLKTGQSLERIKNGGELVDTNNNSQDFILNLNPSPTNSLNQTKFYDPTPPETILDAFPPNPSDSTEANFAFHSNEENSTFECKIDEQDWEACSSPKNYSNLTEENHQFQVRATDLAGNIDPNPAIYSWLIEIPEAPPPPEPANYLLINEIQIDGIEGAGGADDDWVELSNPTTQDISLAGWSIQEHSTSDPCSTESGFYKKNFLETAVVPAQGYFLIVDTQANDNLKMIADLTIGWLLTENNTIYLVNDGEIIEGGEDPNIVDKVGFGESACFSEGNPAPNPPEAQSIERKTLGIDTNDNSQDFQINENPSPTNSKGEAGPTLLVNFSTHLYITEDTTLSLQGSPYLVQGDLTINEGKTLTIEPGATLKFGKLCSLTVNGILKAIGTESKKITFTRLAEDDFWQGIYFGQTSISSELNWTQIEYGQTNVLTYGKPANILVENSSILFKNSTVKNYPQRGLRLKNSPNSLIETATFLGSGTASSNSIGIEIEGGQPTTKNSLFKNHYYGIYINYTEGLALIETNNFEENKYPIWSTPQAIFKENQGQNNTKDGIVISGQVTENLTLFKNSLPYIFWNMVEVSEEKILTIQPGVVIKMAEDAQLKIKGQLLAQGTSEELITFTSLLDCSLNPCPGYWDWIYFYPTSQNSILENITIENGGYYVWLEGSKPMICIEDSQVSLSNLTVRNSAHDGIKILGSEKFPQFGEGLVFQNNANYDIFLEDTNFCSSLPAYLKGFNTNCPNE